MSLPEEHPQEKEAFERFILNHRYDSPQYGLRIDPVTHTYQDPRLSLAFTCWLTRAHQMQ